MPGSLTLAQCVFAKHVFLTVMIKLVSISLCYGCTLNLNARAFKTKTNVRKWPSSMSLTNIRMFLRSCLYYESLGAFWVFLDQGSFSPECPCTRPSHSAYSTAKELNCKHKWWEWHAVYKEYHLTKGFYPFVGFPENLTLHFLKIISKIDAVSLSNCPFFYVHVIRTYFITWLFKFI